MAAKDGSGPRPSALPTANLLMFSCSWLSSCTAPVKDTFAAPKNRSGPRPAAQTAKRHLLKWLETSSKPWLCLLFCTANCQLARALLQLAFFLRSSGQRTLSQRQNTMAVKDGSGPRPAAQTAKRHLLKWLETVKPWLCLLLCTANCQLARVLLQLAFFLRSSGQRTLSQRQNTMAVKDGSGMRPAAQTAKRHLLKRLETSSKPWLCLLFCTANCQLARVLLQLPFRPARLRCKDGPAGPKHHGSEGRIGNCQLARVLALAAGFRSAQLRSKDPSRSAKTPWQWRTDPARGRQPRLPNVTFWSD